MIKIISRIPVIPQSLIVTGVRIPGERHYIGGGGFGRIFAGELQGTAVALKVLHKSDNTLVSPSTSQCRCYKAVDDFYINRPFVVKH